MPKFISAGINKPLLALLLVLLITSAILLIVYPPKFYAADCSTDNSNFRYDGLLSTPQLKTKDKFPGKNVNCVVGLATPNPRAGFTDIDLQDVYTYQALKTNFYTKTLSQNQLWVAKNPIAGNPFSMSGNGVYTTTDDFTVNGSDFSGSGTAVIFVEKNLNIMTNINYSETDANSGLVFIVQGNINIAKSVTKINAVLIGQGQICTYYDFASSSCQKVVGDPSAQQLAVNGSIISINPTNDQSNLPLKLYRDLSAQGNTMPAEKIIEQPKYLVNLRKILSQTLSITTEDTTFGIQQ